MLNWSKTITELAYTKTYHCIPSSFALQATQAGNLNLTRCVTFNLKHSKLEFNKDSDSLRNRRNFDCGPETVTWVLLYQKFSFFLCQSRNPAGYKLGRSFFWRGLSVQ